MKLRYKFTILLLAVMLASPGYAAKDPVKAAIKARQGEMQLRAYNAGPLFAMAKGEIPYDPAQASMLSGNLLKLLDIDIGSAWVKGSGSNAYPDDTTALDKIWSSYPEITRYGKKYMTAVRELAADSGNGLGALKSRVGALGKSCKSCHDEFREKK